MLSLNPPTQISSFRGPPDTLAKMVAVAQGDRGERSIFVRSVVEEVLGDLWPKAYGCEILAINNWVSEKVVYVNDPLHVELVKDPQRLCEEIKAKGKARGDCDDIAVLIATMGMLVGRKAEYICAGFAERGNYSHVFTRILEPRTNQWIVCDPVAGTKVASMLGRITTYQIWSCDELPSHGPVKVK